MVCSGSGAVSRAGRRDARAGLGNCERLRVDHVRVVGFVVAKDRVIGDAALAKQQSDQLGTVHSREFVWIADYGCDQYNGHDLGDRVFAQFGGLPSVAPLDVRLDENRSDDAAENAEKNEWNQFDEDPVSIVVHIEHDGVLGTERVDRSENEGGNQRTEERPPHGLQRKVIADFF